MAAAVDWTVLLLALLNFCHPGLSVEDPATDEFIINGVPYPASSEYTAVYIVTPFDGDAITIVCNHSMSGETPADWTVVSFDFQGPGLPGTGPVPIGAPQTILVDVPGAVTEYASDGMSTLTFLSPTVQMEGVYSCAGSLRLRLTFSNPYVEESGTNEFPPLSDTLILCFVTRYADGGLQKTPGVGDVVVSATFFGAPLTILEAKESTSNPYLTKYEVSRPENLYQDTLNFSVTIDGVTASDIIVFSIEDFVVQFAGVTVIPEGDEFVFNCTTTVPGVNATFTGGPPLLMETNPPVDGVWMFPAVVENSARYECMAQFEMSERQSTELIVYPTAVENDVVFVDLDSGRFLPDSYIILNFPTREGIRIACVSRIDGTLLSLTSLNDTITQQYARREFTTNGAESLVTFSVGADSITVAAGERFIELSMSVRSVYGDTLTCSSDSSRDTATLRIVPDIAYVSINPPGVTAIVFDYNQPNSISFIYEGFSPPEVVQGLRGFRGDDFTRDSDNDQLYSLLLSGFTFDDGVYVMRSMDRNSPNASIDVIIVLPVVTISPQSKEVNEGDDFTLTCTPSILGLEFDWDHPNRFSDFPNVEFSQPLQESITVFGAMRSNEGSYTCRIREMREAVIASANATVDIIFSCPDQYAGGILWESQTENSVAFSPCRDADGRFSDGVVVSRECVEGGQWMDPNFSGCTLSSSDPQRFVIFSLYYLISNDSVEQAITSDELIKVELDDLASGVLGTNYLSSSLVIVPGSGFIPVTGTVIIRMRYTVTYNTSARLEEQLIDTLSNTLTQLLLCTALISPEGSGGPLFSLLPNPFTGGDAVGFERSGVCECRLGNEIIIIPPDGEGPPPFPPNEGPRRKRGGGGEGCPVPLVFTGFQQMCNGTTAAPCACLDDDCQCVTPYVGNGDYCVLDRDGDSYPEVVPDIICGGDNTSSYCILDICPNVPNSDPTDPSLCEGYEGGVVFCEDEIDAVWEIQWPNTLVGNTATVPCGVDFIGNATRMCGAGGVWADPDVIDCSSRVFIMVQVEIAALLEQEEVDVEETLEAFEGLVEVTEDPLFPADIDTAIENVNTVLSLLEDGAMLGMEVENVAVIFEVLDNLLVDGNLESFNVLEDVEGGQRVLNNVERYALYVSQVLQNEGGDIVRNQAGENIVLRAGSVRVEEDETFPDPAEVAGLNVSSDTSASITLPSQLLASRSQGGRVGVASVLFRNLQAFLPEDSDTPTPRSLVISGQVANEGGNGEIDPVLEDNPVIITFSFEVGEDEDIGEDDVDCVFWDFGGNAATSSDTVRWSTDGLRTESVTRDGNTVTVTCASFHLTSFAVLVDVGGAQLEDEALQIVSYIGLAISLACLLLTIIFFLSLGKKLFSAVHNFVHLNLAISLFIGYLVFAVGIELASHDRVACNVVTALIQYFLLAAFCWMMCEGIMLYLMLVVVFSKLKKKWWFFALLGWGIPVIFVVIGLASVRDEYGVRADDESDDYYKYCWLSSGNGTHAIWTFVAPMLAIILINTVFLVLVLYSIFKNRAGRQQKVDQGFRVDAVQYVVKASVILLPLLGLTWVFGLFAVNENTAVFAWLFTILNSLQGVFIFIFHVLRNDRIWGRIKKKYESYSISRASKSTDSTGVKSGKYHAVSSTTSGIEMKEKQSLADPEVSEAVDDEKPTKEELA